MSQLRPGIIRADTIDLQDRSQPSAKDHSASQLRDDSEHSVGRHQAETLREVADEAADEHTRRPPDARDNGHDGYAADRTRLYSDDSSDDDSDDDSSFGDSVGVKDDRGAADETPRDKRKMNQQDALAIAQNGGAQDDDSDLDIDGDDLEDDMSGGISSSPSIEDEDIDFEYVYALHTFVATVEGQANATKGDTMVLLDDSNSYWWLVRIVKDSSIGYLPAEHIETPTERLARLNKHRNIDLSATMLGDQQEKSKATFKTAIRRRKKTVTFAAPTYVDYSDIEYSTDEEDQEEIFARQQMAAQQAREQAASAESGKQDGETSEVEDDTARVEPLKMRAPKEAKVAADPTKQEQAKAEAEPRPSSEDILEGKQDGQSRSRNGTLRNTDSFFKDDSVETKKITLTPNLLRDDSAPRESSESKELRPRPSLDKLEKDPPASKEDKKKKEKDKKPSAIRNFFSRKDKKKGSADDDESVEKRSMESQARDSREGDADETPNNSPQRHPSKLQKAQPRTEPSPTRKGSQKSSDLAYVPETRNDVSNVPPATMRIVDAETQETIEVASSAKDDASRRSSMQLKPSPVISAEAEKQDAQQPKTSPLPEPERSPEAPAPADSTGPPALVGDSSSQEEHSASPSPELPEEEEPKEKGWDDEKLRAFFDSGSDVRDMLVVVYDKTDVAPAGPDHPVVGGLFREQNAKLAEITTQLDNMLGDWLARKQRTRGSV